MIDMTLSDSDSNACSNCRGDSRSDSSNSDVALTPRGITKRGAKAQGRQTARGSAVMAVSESEGQSHRDFAGNGPDEGSVT